MFDKSHIEIVVSSKEKYGDVELVEYTATYNHGGSKNKCFVIVVTNTYIQIKGIKYENEINCLLSGNSILDKIETFAKKIGVKSISLSDGSEIYIDDTNSYSLSRYYILLHGMSWYNSRGYVSSNTENEKKKNKIVNATPMNQINKLLQSSVYQSVVDGLSIYEIDSSEPIGKIMYKLDELRKSGEYGYELMKVIKMFVDLITKSGVLHYNMALRKEIDVYGSGRKKKTRRKRKTVISAGRI